MEELISREMDWYYHVPWTCSPLFKKEITVAKHIIVGRHIHKHSSFIAMFLPLYSQTFILHYNVPPALFTNIHPSLQYSFRFIHKHSSFITMFLPLYSQTFILHYNVPPAHPFTRLYMFVCCCYFFTCTSCTISLPLGHRIIFTNAMDSHGVGVFKRCH